MNFTGVRRNVSQEGTLRLMVDEKGKPAIFPTIRDAMVFAASLGFQRREKRELDTKTKLIEAEVFERNEESMTFLFALALAELGGSEILKEAQDASMIVQVFEEYAAGGLAIIEEWQQNTPSPENIVESLIAFLKAEGYIAV